VGREPQETPEALEESVLGEVAAVAETLRSKAASMEDLVAREVALERPATQGPLARRLQCLA